MIPMVYDITVDIAYDMRFSTCEVKRAVNGLVDALTFTSKRGSLWHSIIIHKFVNKLAYHDSRPHSQTHGLDGCLLSTVLFWSQRVLLADYLCGWEHRKITRI